MKKIICLILAAATVMSMTSCSKKKKEQPESTNVTTPVTTPSPTPEPTKSPEDIFLSTYINTDERPIAVMVDNDNKQSRPHAGLNEAYLIYEMYVEGGATRFMALFKATDTEKIGPVRSSRHYYLDYVMENDAIYTHFGWSPKAIQDINAFKIQKINGILGEDGNVFWREAKFKGDWHSAFTSIANIKEQAQKKSFPLTTTEKNGIKYAKTFYTPDSGVQANKVSLNYAGHYKTGYTYNPETKLYEKTILGEPHVMQNGEVLTVKNVLVQLIKDTSLGDGTARRNINTTGEGKGYYFTNGVCEEITWSKASRRDDTIYYKADGSALEINPGKTIVNIISPTIGVQFE